MIIPSPGSLFCHHAEPLSADIVNYEVGVALMPWFRDADLFAAYPQEFRVLLERLVVTKSAEDAEAARRAGMAHLGESATMVAA